MRATAILGLLLVAGCAGQHFVPDAVVLDRIGPEVSEQLSAVQSAKSFRVTIDYYVDKDGNLLGEWEHGRLDGFLPIVEVGPELNESQLNMLMQLLGSSQSYDLTGDATCDCCYIEPEYGFEMSGLGKPAFVFLGVRCRQVYIRYCGESVLLAIAPEARGFSALAEELFGVEEVPSTTTPQGG